MQNTMKKSPSASSEPFRTPSSPDESECQWANIKLRKRSEENSIKATPAEGNKSTGELAKVILRKPRSRSEGDLLDEKPRDDEANSELKKILERHKQAADKGNK